MTTTTRPLLAFLAVFAVAGPTEGADPAARPIVAGFERFPGGPGVASASGGRLLIGELGCASCHGGADFGLGPVAAKRAPILDAVGSRVRVDHLRRFLRDPHAVKPGTTMPDALAGRPDADVEALVHFLASTGSTTPIAPSRKAIAADKTLYEESGCAACHGSTRKDATPPGFMVPMGDAGSKYSYGSLAAFLLDPLACRPSGRMPGMGLKPDEARSIASYLMRGEKLGPLPELAYEYYEGWWTALPDFDKLVPKARGTTEGIDLAAAKRKNGYGLRFRGTLEVDRDGPYSFVLSSDDGSRLAIDGKVVVDHDGIHPNSEKRGRVRLTKGKHPVVLDYFDGGGEALLDVEYEGPGMIRHPLGSDLLGADGSKPGSAVAERFEADPALADRGRTLFASAGCASCHQLREGDRAVAPRPPGRPLGDVRAGSGCLAAEPPAGVPDYDLSEDQRAAIAAALKAHSPPMDRRQRVDSTLLAFNCYTCHARDGVGGVEEGWSGSFATTQKEMGDEGRIPPNLTGVGGKLTEQWLRHVLADGAKDRPYMRTRMPRFGEGNVGHLVEPLAAGDAVPPVDVPDLGVPAKRAKATGRFIVGAQAFNCGSCHQFKEFEASGIQALDMTKMTQRLRRDWFHRYVVDPQLYRPGTRMPAAWPGGKSQLEAIYDGDTLKQVESIWLYLSDGADAAVPYGLGRDPIPLVADRSPIVYRNFIQGAGPRAIGVGYPEKANLAFDAEDLRLALIWQGAFIDASKHWSGRGEGFQTPLGDNILALAAGPTFARLADPAATWPRRAADDPGLRFRGYRLGAENRPTFLYDVGPVRVEDRPEPVPGREAPTLRRTLDLVAGGPAPGLTIRVAAARQIEPMGEGWFRVDGEWKVRLGGTGEPIVRPSAGRSELVAPIVFEAGKARVVEEFAW